MENRIAGRDAERPGAALIGLTAIVLITVAWWALALWPTPGVEPEWLARTRAACFGSARGELPDAGGWVLLVGEPLGMLAALLAGWRRSVGAQLRWVWNRRAGSAALRAVGGMLASAVGAAGARVARASQTASAPVSGVAARVNRSAPDFALLDQHGRLVRLTDFRGRPLIVVFAFGHCATVCPAAVHDMLLARRNARRMDVPLVVATLDPWRDTPDRLPSIANAWGLGPGDHVLSGSVADVERVLDAFGVSRRRDETTGDVAHVPRTLLVDAGGRIAWRVDGGWAGDAMTALLTNQE